MLNVKSAELKSRPVIMDRAVKATLYHLDGNTSEIVLTIPRYTDWIEYMEEAELLIKEYVNRLTRYWVRISHFKTEIGSFDKNGEFKAIFKSPIIEVPLDKVYSSGVNGQWVKPEEHPDYLKNLENMKGGKLC